MITETHHHHYPENSDEEVSSVLTEDLEDMEEVEDTREGAFAEGGLVIMENPNDQDQVDNAETMQEAFVEENFEGDEVGLDEIAAEAEADADLIGEDPAEVLGDEIAEEELEDF